MKKHVSAAKTRATISKKVLGATAAKKVGTSDAATRRTKWNYARVDGTWHTVRQAARLVLPAAAAHGKTPTQLAGLLKQHGIELSAATRNPGTTRPTRAQSRLAPTEANTGEAPARSRFRAQALEPYVGMWVVVDPSGKVRFHSLDEDEAIDWIRDHQEAAGAIMRVPRTDTTYVETA